METFNEEHKTCFDFTIILKAMLSSKMMKEMESDWFNSFHLKTRIKTGTPTV